MITVKWSTMTTFLGRNGCGKCSGIEAITSRHVIDDDTTIDTVLLSPLTSRGNVARNWIEIPLAAVPEFIEKLTEYVKREDSK